jgi:hypothetical protein
MKKRFGLALFVGVIGLTLAGCACGPQVQEEAPYTPPAAIERAPERPPAPPAEPARPPRRDRN